MNPVLIAIVAAVVAVLTSAIAVAAMLPRPLSADERLGVGTQFALAFALCLNVFRGVLPTFITITLMNTLVVGGFLVRASLLAPAHERALMKRVTLLAIVCCAMVFEAFRETSTPMAPRVAASGAFLGAVALLEARNAFAATRTMRTRLPRVLVVFDVILACSQWWRVAGALGGSLSDDYFKQPAVQVPGFLASIPTSLLGILAFVAIRLERVHDAAVVAAERSARAEAERTLAATQHEATKRLLAERTDLLDVLAHEIRQPLNNASAALEVAVAHDVAASGASGDAALVPSGRAALVLGRVISTLNNTLAAATRLTDDTYELERMPADLRVIVELARFSFDRSRASRIDVSIRASTTQGEFDPMLMQLAVRNLLDNALKFSAPDARVSLVLDDVASGDWRVSVANAGRLEGFVAEHELFGKRVRGVSGRSIDGAGLGLFIVRRVSELHGGEPFFVASGDGVVTVGFTFA